MKEDGRSDDFSSVADENLGVQSPLEEDTAQFDVAAVEARLAELGEVETPSPDDDDTYFNPDVFFSSTFVRATRPLTTEDTETFYPLSKEELDQLEAASPRLNKRLQVTRRSQGDFADRYLLKAISEPPSERTLSLIFDLLAQDQRAIFREAQALSPVLAQLCGDLLMRSSETVYRLGQDPSGDLIDISYGHIWDIADEIWKDLENAPSSYILQTLRERIKSLMIQDFDDYAPEDDFDVLQMRYWLDRVMVAFETHERAGFLRQVERITRMEVPFEATDVLSSAEDFFVSYREVIQAVAEEKRISFRALRSEENELHDFDPMNFSLLRDYYRDHLLQFKAWKLKLSVLEKLHPERANAFYHQCFLQIERDLAEKLRLRHPGLRLNFAAAVLKGG